MTNKIRWGIVGTGGIAHKFAQALAVLPDAKLTAVSSRKKETAEKFASEFNIPNTHVGVESLAADNNVDVVYIATPHTNHNTETISCLKAGKAVLCEKPLAINSRQVAEMIQCAKENNVFLMEAMWTYFFPAVKKIRQIISAGDIGEVRFATVNFCVDFNNPDPQGRLLNPNLAGGTLLDIGIYDIAYAQMIFGKEPLEIASLANFGPTGVDEQASMIFKYDKGQIANLNCAANLALPCEALIFGTKGRIKVPHMFFHPDKFTVEIGSSHKKEYTFDRLGNGYTYEAIEVMQCLKDGKIQSDIMPWSTSVSFMNIMDKIRKQWNFVYPMEK
ncbi:MAG: Gfo/Idh/MocA family oxidoreductase [Phycisphaerales bacterium]